MIACRLNAGICETLAACRAGYSAAVLKTRAAEGPLGEEERATKQIDTALTTAAVPLGAPPANPVTVAVGNADSSNRDRPIRAWTRAATLAVSHATPARCIHLDAPYRS